MKMKGDKPIVGLALLSGGLDSALASVLMQQQGVKVVGINFTCPFWNDTPFCEERIPGIKIARSLGIPLKTVPLGEDFLRIVKEPKYGYGSGLNPCIDCRIFILKKAAQFAESIGAKFLITGDVLGQRPMSQFPKTLTLIDREARLTGKVLRPLSAQLLPETEVERSGLVDRKKLLSLKGRSRRPQLALAKELNIKDFLPAAGGCLLTAKPFAKRLAELFRWKERMTWKDIELLKVGRHFRSGKNWIIVGRNEEENEILLRLKPKEDYLFYVPDWGSPITILQGPKTKAAIRLAARLTARYSDCQAKRVVVKYGKRKGLQKITLSPLPPCVANSLNLSLKEG